MYGAYNGKVFCKSKSVNGKISVTVQKCSNISYGTDANAIALTATSSKKLAKVLELLSLYIPLNPHHQREVSDRIKGRSAVRQITILLAEVLLLNIFLEITVAAEISRNVFRA